VYPESHKCWFHPIEILKQGLVQIAKFAKDICKFSLPPNANLLIFGRDV
jgi:hypothetical protein